MPGRSAILTYHSLDESLSVISTAPALFRRQMQFLASSGIPVVPLDQALHAEGAVAITFDDGFCNFLDDALPVLEQYRFPATVFVVPGHCGGRNNWGGAGAPGIPDLPLLDWPRLSGLPSSISIGAHTLSHPDLTRLPAADCERELRGCRDQIEQRLGRPARWLAYPFGASSPAVRSIAARYFDLAVGTSLRFLPPQPGRMDLPRVDTYYLRGAFGLQSLFHPVGRIHLRLRQILREMRQRWS